MVGHKCINLDRQEPKAPRYKLYTMATFATLLSCLAMVNVNPPWKKKY